jgi:hypothetical protein
MGEVTVLAVNRLGGAPDGWDRRTKEVQVALEVRPFLLGALGGRLRVGR